MSVIINTGTIIMGIPRSNEYYYCQVTGIPRKDYEYYYPLRGIMGRGLL